MQSFITKMNELLRTREQHRIGMAVATVLSLLVVVLVCTALIMPAISQESVHESTLDYVGSTDGAFLFKPKISTIAITQTEGTEVEESTMSVDFNLTYDITNDMLNKGSNCIYYNLNTDRNDDSGASFLIPEGGLPASGLYGQVKSQGEVVGAYRIEEDGTVYIWFDDDFVAKANSLSDGENLDGTIAFTAELKAKEGNTSDDITLDFGGKDGSEVIVTVPGFTYSKISVDKATPVLSEDNKTLSWTVTIDNPDGSELENIILSDTRFGEASDIKIVDSNSNTVSVTINENNQLVLGSTTDKKLTVTYTTEVDQTSADMILNGGWVGNTATLLKPDESDEISKDTSGINVPALVTVAKTGSVEYGKDSDVITWTVTIDNPDGVDLSNFKLEDFKFNSLEPDNFTVVDGDGNPVAFTYNKVTNGYEASEIILGADVTSKTIKVIYSTTVDKSTAQDSDYQNSVSLKDYDETSYVNTQTSVSRYIFDVTKGGSEIDRTGKIQWNVKVEDYDKTDSYMLSDFVVCDDVMIAWLNSLTEAERAAALTITAPAGNDTINIGYIVITDSEGNVTGIQLDKNSYDESSIHPWSGNNYVTISYQTDADMGEEFSTTDEAGNITTTNTVEILGDNIYDSASATVTYNTQTEVTKAHQTPFLSSDWSTLTVPWTITIKGEKGSFDTVVINDTMIASQTKDDITTNLTHEFGQITKVTYKTEAGGTAVDFTDYTLTDNGNGTFTLSLDKTESNADTIAEIVELTVTYDSLVHIPEGVDLYDGIFVKNTADVGDKKAEDSFLYEPVTSVNKYKGNASLSEDGQSLILPWTVQISGDEGTFTSLYVIDSMTASSGDCETTHIYDSLTKVTVRIDGNWRDIETGYTLTPTETGFNFELDDTVYDLAKMTDLKIEYTSKVALDYTVLSSGDTVTYKNTVEAFGKQSSADGSYTVINPNNAIVKTSLYESSTMKPEELSTANIDGIDCYIFKWRIAINENGKYSASGPVYLTDTLPAGFKLYTGATREEGFYWREAKNEYINGNIGVYDSNAGWQDVSYILSENGGNQIVTFRVDYTYSTAEYWIYYLTYIPKTELKAMLAQAKEDGNSAYDVTNTVTEGDNSSSSTVHVSDNSSGEVSDKEGLLTKTYEQKTGGYITYTVDFNPDAMDLLPGSDIITILDEFNFGTTYTDIDGNVVNSDPSNLLNVSLVDINFYEVDSEGNETLLDPQPHYIFEDAPKVITTTEHSFEQTTSEDLTWPAFIDAYLIKDVKDGSVVTVTLSGEQLKQLSNISIYTKPDTGWEWVRFVSETSPVKVDDNTYEWTFEVSLPSTYDGICNIHIEYGSYDSEGSNLPVVTSAVSTLTEETCDARLQMNVPDGKHIRAVYKYQCLSDTVATVPGTVNTVSTSSKWGSHSDSSTVDYEAHDDSSATVTSELTIKKVDASNSATLLEAGFALARYNSSTGSWEYAQGVSNRTVTSWGSDVTEVIVTKTGLAQFIISLDSGYLYQIIEVRWPDGYDTTYSDNKYFVYKCQVSDVTIPSAGPDGGFISTSDVYTYTTDSTLVVKNRKSITVTAEKQWADSSDHTQESVAFELWSSITKTSSGTDIPADAVKVFDAVELNEAKGWTCQWENLPSTDDSGRLLYYYVVELKDGLPSGYSPWYNGNGLNESGTITVTNSKGITVTKEWIYDDGTAITDDSKLPASISFKLYRSKTLSTELPADAEVITDAEGNEVVYTIYKSNDWKLDVTGLAAGDTEGNTYYYYVQEIAVDGYTSNYKINGAQYNGIITVENVKESESGITLPGTGGNGTARYIGYGLLIMALAGILLVAFRFRPIAVNNKNKNKL
ncbi:MAG: Cna B-type domain-containing protein [Lachnospiraceae bacterium]